MFAYLARGLGLCAIHCRRREWPEPTEYALVITMDKLGFSDEGCNTPSDPLNCDQRRSSAMFAGPKGY
jgi:hypothetical protein